MTISLPILTMPKFRHGFSLVELMAVLAIIGILAAIAIPSYAAYVTRTRRIEAQVALVEAMQLEERYYTDHNAYAAFSADADTPAAKRFRWHSGATPAGSAYELRAAPCEGQSLAECVRIEAMPGTARVDGRFRDPECGTLSLDSATRQGASGKGSGCWP
jgi:type IV pilus assembly protein PilE